MQNFPGFLRGLAVFLGVSVPAALVNSGLRLFQKQIQLAFMLRLSRHLHQLYCSNRSYYSASVLGGARLGCHLSCPYDALSFLPLRTCRPGSIRQISSIRVCKMRCKIPRCMTRETT
jgi:hypothetical protein